MFISPEIYDALLDAGVQMVDRGDTGVDFYIAGDDGAEPLRCQIKTSHRSVGPAQLTHLAAENPNVHLLLIATALSPAARDALIRYGWSWITSSPGGALQGELRFPKRAPIHIGRSDDRQEDRAEDKHRGRKPWQRFAIIRHLLLKDGWSQARLATVCQATQPRVSQVLKGLQRDGLVAASVSQVEGGRRWSVSNSQRLLSTWLTNYPGPGGSAPTYWYGLDSLANQTYRVIEHLSRLGDAPSPIASGDAAADLIAPYRRSRIAVIYAAQGADLAEAGLTPAPEDSATLKLVVPTDQSVWPSDDNRSVDLASGAPIRLADPLQVMWDLQTLGGPDADQAVEAVRRVFLDLRARDRQ